MNIEEMFDYSLGNKPVSVREMMQYISDTYRKKYRNVDVIFNDQDFIGTGYTHYDPHINDYTVIFGTQPLFGNKFTDQDYINGIKIVCHEYRHVRQMESNFEVCGKYASECRIDFMACYCSNTYYGYKADNNKNIVLPHYFKNIREIDAEYQAFEETPEFLSDKDFFPGVENVDTVMFQYANRWYKEGVTHEPSYISVSKDVTSWVQIKESRNQQMKTAMYKKPDTYDPHQDKDSILSTIMSCDEYPWNKLADMIDQTPDNKTQRRLIAAVMMKVDPVLWKTRLKRNEINEVQLESFTQSVKGIYLPKSMKKMLQKNGVIISSVQRPLPDMGMITDTKNNDFNIEY